MREIGSNDTSVHPGFRKTLFSMSGGVSFGEAGIPEATTLFVKTMELNDKFAQYGDGMYPNEAAQATPDWQSHFWGSNYNRLCQIKLREDPDDFFKKYYSCIFIKLSIRCVVMKKTNFQKCTWSSMYVGIITVKKKQACLHGIPIMIGKSMKLNRDSAMVKALNSVEETHWLVRVWRSILGSTGKNSL